MNSFFHKLAHQKALVTRERARFFFFVLLLILFFGIAGFKAFVLFSTDRVAQRPVSFLEDWSTDTLPFNMPAIRLFSFGDHTCSIDAYGAVGDGVTLNTKAIALAIKDCADQGGGTVIVPAGRYLTGAIHLESDIALDVQEGAELLFSQNAYDYLPAVFSRYEGMEYYGYSPFISARDCHDIALTGKGLINGQGQAWWDWKRWQQAGAKKLYALAEAGAPPEERVFATTKDGLRPALIEFTNCERIAVEGVTLKNGPMWTLHPLYSKDILIRDITVLTEGPNNDGIVIDSSSTVLIENVRLNTEDDAIVIKSGVDRDGQRVGKPAENIVIRNCSVGRGNGGVVIGSEMSGDVRNVFVSHCDFDGTKRGFRVKSAPGRGGIVENIWIENITMENIVAEAIFLNMFYDSKNVVRPTTANPPIFRNFFFKNITCTQANDAIVITGASDSFIKNVSFENIDMQAKTGISMQNIDTLSLNHIRIEAKTRPLMTLTNLRHATFDLLDHPPVYRPFILINGTQSEDIRFAKGYTATTLRIGRGIPKTTVIRE